MNTSQYPAGGFVERGRYGRCNGCGQLMYPILELCPGGDEGTIAEIPLEEAGVVYSWTQVAGRADDARPTWFAMADFFEGKLRVVGPVRRGERVEIGDHVKLTETSPGIPVLVPCD